MTATERDSDLNLTTDITYLAFTGELCGVDREYVGKNWLR